MHPATIALAASGTLAALAAAPAAGQYELTRAVIAGGGGGSTGGPFAVRDTIGQAVVGPSAAGAFELEAGFWAGVEPAVGPCNPADVAPTGGSFGQLDGNDIAAFVRGFIEMDPIADIASTGGVFGQFDGNDIALFVRSFLAGCP